MELRQLRYFVAVAEELHFGRAAARLLIATPSLSQQIKALERSLGVPLFRRTSTRVSLTAAGAELLPLARATLAASDDLVDAARGLAEGRATVLRLGFLPFTLTATTRRLLTEFGREAPDVTVRLRQYEWADPSAGLLSGETDAALARPPFTGVERLRLLELGTDDMLAVVAEGHRLARAEAVTRAELAREPWLETEIVTDPVFAREWYLTDLRGDDSPSVRTSAGTVEEWLAEIAFGRGINVVPAGMAEEYRRPGIAFVPVSDAPPSRLAVAWPAQDAAPAAISFARFAAGWARRSRT